MDVTDRDGRQPLLWASSSGTFTNYNSWTHYCRCFDVTLDTSFTGSTDAIVTLVNAGADVGAPDKDGLRALHCAASRGHKDCAEALVALCGAAPDQQDYNGCSALFYAVTLGHVQCSEFLLNAGTNANAQDKKGRR